MLPDERTTHNNTLSLPSDVEGLVAAPGRGVARPLVDFLKGQGINVQTTSGADAVFGPGTDAQERRTRLWALLRTRALYRQIEKKQRAQGSEIVERRRWL